MYKNNQITAIDIEKALLKKHAKDICFPELRLSSGYALPSRVDFLAINVGPSTGNRIDAYEIKVSKSDFKRDTHKKQRGARLFSDLFWYIAPKGIILHEDVPDWAGLIEVEWFTYTFKSSKPFLKFSTVISAPKRDKDSPSWGLVVSLIRNALRKGGANSLNTEEI